jgi:hypothetical protein
VSRERERGVTQQSRESGTDQLFAGLYEVRPEMGKAVNSLDTVRKGLEGYLNTYWFEGVKTSRKRIHAKGFVDSSGKRKSVN